MMTDFDADSPPLLPAWATLTQVSDALNIPRSAVRSAARRALKREEPWVKKEAGSSGSILLDTQHACYHGHATRWQVQKASAETSGAAAPCVVAPETLEAGEDCACPSSWYSLASDGFTAWPAFCRWLAAQGLQVFTNRLRDEAYPMLTWQWGDLQGERPYTSVKEAVIAAVDARFRQPFPDLVPCSLNEQECHPSLLQRLWQFWRGGGGREDELHTR